MPKFEKVETQVDFPSQERHLLQFWDEIRAFEKLRAKNRGKPRWSFLDGPITANNPMGVHHAWGRTYKDAFQRYFAMTGHELRYQNGFDCQGLWVEVEVERELKLQSKRDIENLVPGDRFASIDRFVALCKQRVDRFARIQTQQSIRLGYWMDWDRTDEDWAKSPDHRKSYFTMSEENNYTIWSFLKKCHQRGLVYRAFDAMPWCPRCGVGLSEMEVKEGYKQTIHKSVFVKFPLRSNGRSASGQGLREFLLVWTTTPWTLSSNVAAAVNPDLQYIRVRLKDEIFYLGREAFKAARSADTPADDEVEVELDRPESGKTNTPKLRSIEQFFKEKAKEGYEILGELAGSEMVGWEYDGPFDHLPAQDHPSGFPLELAEVVKRQNWAPNQSGKQSHRVIPWKEVGATTGTGIVHIAPGCGQEDFQLGKTHGLPPIAPLDEAGVFLPGFGELSGRSAADPATADWIIDDLKRRDLLFAAELYPHSYPHCWRCKMELLFRLVDEWFIDMKWRGEIMAVTRQVRFLPEAINGMARELKWLEQMHDWMISKKRFWGLALPIWVCEECSAFDVIGGRDELKARAVEGWERFEGHTPHRPWVDLVKLRCSCGGTMSRIPDVGNPWLDAGIVPYSTMGYNHRGKKELPPGVPRWEDWFPADFITESFPGQFRNWFYAILAMSTMMENRPPFKTLLGHATVRDERGDIMSKSKGNAIEFNEAADRMGADVMRWLYARTNPAQNINFGYGPANEIRAKFHLKLWNSYAFFVNYARLDRFDPDAPRIPVSERSDIDRWILSDLQLLIRTARRAFEEFDLMRFCLETERFVDDKLSNWYIRRNRRRFWRSEEGADKLAAYQTLYEVLTTLCRLIAPVVPFMAEAMWQNIRRDADPESVHLCDYPEADESLVDKSLSDDMETLFTLVALGSAARNEAKLKVRQPLAEIRLGPEKLVRPVVERFGQQLLEELNIRQFHVPSEAEGPLRRARLVLIKKSAAPKLGPHLKAVEERLASASVDADRLTAYRTQGLTVEGREGQVTLVFNEDFELQYENPPGWVGATDGRFEVLVDTRITEDLKRAGLAREVVRHIQESRKAAGLEMEDRIRLFLRTDSPLLQEAVNAHRDYIAAETLTVDWPEDLQQPDGQTEVAIEGSKLEIRLAKV
ncbi:MAG: isoleucine--tRNA ligase [Gemmataceae bacterium]|nr:isoleucine--tRNA ligase [Gemmataceae bacterium]